MLPRGARQRTEPPKSRVGRGPGRQAMSGRHMTGCNVTGRRDCTALYQQHHLVDDQFSHVQHGHRDSRSHQPQ
jgi:hypothetical protein